MCDVCHDYIELRGKIPLGGALRVHGAKNAVLPILAATLLGGESIIEDCPMLSDVEATLEILRALGCKAERSDTTVYVNAKEVTATEVPFEQMRKMRSSVFFLGALAARCGEAHMCLPGGCDIGRRPVDIHVAALQALGMRVVQEKDCLHCYRTSMRPKDIVLPFPSVGATENAILAATGVRGSVRIIGGAREPEIDALLSFLNAKGASCVRRSDGSIEINGSKPKQSVRFKIIPDRILTATLLAAVTACGGDCRFDNVICAHLGEVMAVFSAMGAELTEEKNALRIKKRGRSKPIRSIVTAPYPGFPTDAQAIVMACLLTAEGNSEITEKIFEARFAHVGEFAKMGAEIATIGEKAMIYGVDTLYGATVTATDLRAGAALCVAGVGAMGTTRVFAPNHIERGYDDLPAMLRKIGAYAEKKG